MRNATCHPEKTHYARGLCRPCYDKQPSRVAVDKTWRKGAKNTARQKRYDKGPLRAVVFRRSRHGFDNADEAKFQAIINCEWCGYPFNGELPRIDHDHRCCNGDRHCHECTRGFVHHNCNVQAIAYCEWLEKKFGTTELRLKMYRTQFPVPRGGKIEVSIVK